MSDKHHLIIPCAVLPQDDGAPPPPVAPVPPSGPNLRALLAAMAPSERIECGADSPSLPYEIALARANGLPGEPGFIPWAAFETGTVGQPCAWIRLCHWQVGVDEVTLLPPADMAIDIETSDALLAAIAPYFEEDGLTLRGLEKMPGTWLATGELLRGLECASLERLAGKRLSRAALQTRGEAAAKVRRLQNEMQMLLYTHPANDARAARGLPPVNAFWVAGAGVLEHPVPIRQDVLVENRLWEPAHRHDAAAHARAWEDVDAGSIAALLAVLRAGGDARLTLCGEWAAQSFVPAQGGVWRNIKRKIGLQGAWDGFNQL